MLLIEPIAMVLTLLCVLKLSDKSHIGWPLGILAAAAYFIVFYEDKLYMQTGLQIIYIIQSIYGWIIWKKDGLLNLQITKAKNYHISRVFMVAIFSGIIGGHFLETYTDASFPYLDAISVSIALLANYLLAKRVVQSWYLWCIVNMILIYITGENELWWTMALYVILLLIAISTAIDWTNEVKRTEDGKKI